MRWNVVRLEAEDFMGFSSLDLDLTTYKGITGILGNRGAGHSNGAGKSTIFKLICWIGWGKLPSKTQPQADKVIRRTATACMGRMTIALSDGRSFVIERHRHKTKGPTLRVTGLNDGTKEGMQEIIDATIGAFEEFTTRDMFSGEMSSFCRLTDAARKELLERMLGIERFAEAAKRADDAYTDANAKLNALRLSLPTYEGAVERCREGRQRAIAATIKHPVIVMRRFRELFKKVQRLADKADTASEALAVSIRKTSAEKAIHAAARAKAERRVVELEDATAAIDAKLVKCNDALAGLRAKTRELTDNIANIESGKHPDICPTCAQRWPHEHDPGDVAKRVEKFRSELADVKRQSAPLDAEVVNLKTERADTQTALAEARRAVRNAESQADDRAFRRALTDALEADADLRSAQQELAEYAASNSLDAETDEVEELEAELAEAKTRLAETKAAITEMADNAERFKFWKKGFGKSGIPAFLVDGAVPDMNKTAAEVAAILTDGELTVSFDPTATKGSQNVFAVNVDYAEGGEGFEMSSRGEQTRVDMSVLFAIRDFAAGRGHAECGQLFLDEVMDGADEHFAEAFLSMVRQRYGDKQVFLISHEPSVASLCDQTITVKKRKGVAKLV